MYQHATLPPAPGDKAHERTLLQGACWVGTGGRIATLLGSCVSITLWHPRRHIGAMSHSLLWSRPEAAATLDARYGEEALQLMKLDLLKLGVPVAECEAKLFGGGSMFPAHSPPGAGVGQRHGDDARQALQALGIPVVSESLFGIGHRQIVFDLDTGAVWSRQLRPVLPDAAERRAGA
jgi:chemotaxis protein CheD